MRALAVVCAVALVAIWLGYPLVMVVLAALWRRRRVPPWTVLPRLSFVIATREKPEAVQQRVDDALAADYDPTLIEVVVALDASLPAAERATYIARDPRVRYLDGDAAGGKAANLNAAMRVATGEIVVFSDTFQRFDRGTVRALVDALVDPRVGATSGRLELPAAQGAARLFTAYWTLEVWLRRAEAVVHSTIGVTGAVWAMRRSLWTPIRPGLILDDVYTPMRLALEHHRVGFVDAARARELRAAESSKEYNRKVRTLTGVMQLCAWLPGVIVPVRNPIWLQFVLHKLLRLATPYLLLGIVPWALVVAWRIVVAWPVVAVAVLAMIVAAHVVTRGRLTRRGWNAIHAVVSVQHAVVRATMNGLRGRWDVWS